jgi:epsilon-lactone hydrolase
MKKYVNGTLTVASVVGRRLVVGPKQRGWSLLGEALMQVLQSGRDSTDASDSEPSKEQRLVSVAKARRMIDRLSKGAPHWMRKESVTIESASGTRFDALWLCPPTLDDVNECKRLPTIVYCHGGGFIVGSIKSHERLASFLAVAAGARVLVVDYRLAPEHRWPAPLEDGLAALDYVVNACGVPREFVALAGDSAGGNMCVGTCLYAVEQRRRDLMPGAMVLLSPWPNLSSSVGAEQKTDTWRTNAPYDYLPTDDTAMARATKEYIGDADPRHPLISPVYAPQKLLAELPPTLITIGGAEQLRADCEHLGEELAAAGVQVLVNTYPGMPHVFQAFGALFKDSRRAIEDAGRFLHFHTFHPVAKL